MPCTAVWSLLCSTVWGVLLMFPPIPIINYVYIIYNAKEER
jgi:hypothetical protein